MRIAFALVVGIHALIHLLGATKAFGWADVPQLRDAISPLRGDHQKRDRRERQR